MSPSYSSFLFYYLQPLLLSLNIVRYVYAPNPSNKRIVTDAEFFGHLSMFRVFKRGRERYRVRGRVSRRRGVSSERTSERRVPMEGIEGEGEGQVN